MGLMYVFPVGEDETDFIDKKDGTLTLKTYGLPYIFWIYALCSVALILFMFLGIQEPVLKLIELGDETDATLGYSLLSSIGVTPIIIFSFFFYEKRIIKHKQELKLIHKIFGLSVFSEKFTIGSPDAFKIESFLSSPNVARINNTNDNAGFQNKGYFVLYLNDKGDRKIQIDRHSRKADLEKLKILLESH